MPSPLNSLRSARPYLGTVVDIFVEADLNPVQLQAAINAAFDAIAHVQQRMSFHEAGSDVSRINAAAVGAWIKVDPATYTVLAAAYDLSQRCGGVFDISIAPVLQQSSFLPTGLDTACDARYQDLLLDGADAVCWQRKGRIDLGGIAKGYAVDCAIAVLRTLGVESAIVNAGGDLRCIGRPQPIHVRHPDQPSSLVDLGMLTDGAIATSASYYSARDGGQGSIDPIVDPQTQRCLSWQSSISVCAPSAMLADALTKVVRLMAGQAEDLAQLLQHFSAQAIMIDQRGMHSLGSPRLFTISLDSL
jgi:thiamine biosynthesis lipoprotein